jgi:hypothetical protein
MTGIKVSFWQIFNMIFGFIGIQIAWSLQTSNMSYVYGNFGGKPLEIAGLWIASALIGLFGHSIIVYLSDRTPHIILKQYITTQKNWNIKFWLGKKSQVAQ